MIKEKLSTWKLISHEIELKVEKVPLRDTQEHFASEKHSETGKR
jgi:hypothetical protein